MRSDPQDAGLDLAVKKRRPASSLPLPKEGLTSPASAPGSAAAAALVGERLEALLREAAVREMPLNDVIRAVMAWAAEQSYAAGGYPHARVMMLDMLETVLLRDAAKKTAAA